MDNGRTLTDADIAAIVKTLKASMVEEFYADLGKGVWAYVKKGIIWCIVGVAAYGALHGYGK